MARAFYVNGESVVSIKAGGHVQSPVSMSGSATVLLGIAEGPIRITPVYHQEGIHTDSMGPRMPVEIMSELAEMKISMTLIHFDRDILDVCVSEGLCGYDVNDETSSRDKAGFLMGNNLALLASGNHFLKMGIESHVAGKPWRFEAAYLDGNPFDFPLGTDRSKLLLNWKAISYVTMGAEGVLTVANPIWDYGSL